MKIYLDIDGVILTKGHELPEYREEFVSCLVSHHDCYWLTTHCHGGGNNSLRYLSQYYPVSTLEKLDGIKPTDWSTLKTDAIDVDSDFIWLEDFPFVSEINMLEKCNRV